MSGLDRNAVEAAWLAHDNACPGEHWKKCERMEAGIRAYLSAVGQKAGTVEDAACPHNCEVGGVCLAEHAGFPKSCPAPSVAEAACEQCGRHVMEHPQPASGFLASCGKRLTRLDECGKAQCPTPSPVVPSGLEALEPAAWTTPSEMEEVRKGITGRFWDNRSYKGCTVALYSADAIAALIAGRDEAVRNAQIVCDSYADENQRLFDRAETAERDLSAAEEVIRPFSDMAGEMFARGWDASNVALALDNRDDPHRVTAGDFFAARRYLAAIRSSATKQEKAE